MVVVVVKSNEDEEGLQGGPLGGIHLITSILLYQVTISLLDSDPLFSFPPPALCSLLFQMAYACLV